MPGSETPRPRHWTLTALAVTVVILAAFWPVWWRGESLMASLGPSSPATRPGAVDEAMVAIAAEHRRTGENTDWNPHLGLGIPASGTGLTHPYSPTRALVHWFPDQPWAYDLTYLARLCIAGIGAAWLALALGCGTAGAVVAGAGFGLTGYFLRHPSWPHLDGDIWLPWLWLAADRLARRQEPIRWIGATFVAYAAFAGGRSGIALAILATWLVTRISPRSAVETLVVLTALAAGVLLASPAWSNGLEYAQHCVSPSSGPEATTAPAVTFSIALGVLALVGTFRGERRLAAICWLWVVLAALPLVPPWATIAPCMLAIAILAGRGTPRHAFGGTAVGLLVVAELVLTSPTSWYERREPFPRPAYAPAKPVDPPLRVADPARPWIGLFGVHNTALAAHCAGDLSMLQRGDPDREHRITGTSAVASAAGGTTPLDDSLPHAFYPARTMPVRERGTALYAATESDTDLRDVAFLEHKAPPAPNPAAGGIARIASWRAGEIRIGVQTRAAGYLVVSTMPYPGWRAEVRKRSGPRLRPPEPATTTPANAVLTAVAVPSGRCELRLYYEPTWATWSIWLRLTGALLLVAGGLWTARKPHLTD